MPAPIGLILGTGWGKIIENLKASEIVPYKQIFGVTSSVPGHEGKVIKAKYKNKNLIILSGRFHTYEGYRSEETVRTIKYLYREGVKKVIITAACGALNPKYEVGDVVILNDIITLFCQSPLVGPKFQDMSAPFSSELRNIATNIAAESKTNFQKGVYCYFRGPHFETFADKMALRFLGADVVGMSVVPEVITARHLGMEVLGLALVTNLAFVKHSHLEVLAAAKKQEKNLYEFVKRMIVNL